MTERTRAWDEEPTLADPSEAPTIPVNTSYRPGVAPVQRRGRGHAEPEPTLVGTAWPHPTPARPPLRQQLRQLRRGREWSNLGALFAFVSWGVWAVSERGTDLAVPMLAFLLVLLVAVGVFALSRLLGRVVLERTLGRTRRSAWPSHLATAIFLTAAGVEYLRRTGWIVEGIMWLRGLG